MKPHWMGHSREDAELEALQTDVMRFIAILGLCLAAIFSLVHSAALEQTAEQVAKQTPPVEVRPAEVRPAEVRPAEVRPSEAEPRTKAETVARLEKTSDPLEPPLPEIRQVQSRPLAEPKPERKPEPTSELKPEPKPEPKPATPAVGFTLEFASATALQLLLQEGQVQLYARRDKQFWSVDARGDFVQVKAPQSYYEMQTETVPRHLRESLPVRGNGSAVTWGVTLPARITKQIRHLTSSRAGGNLVIGRDGTVDIIRQSQMAG